MNWLIEYKLRRLGERASPDPAFIKSLEAKLMPEKTVLKTRIPLVLRWSAVALSVVLVGGGATSAYAYASDGIMPGDELYPVKLKVEELVEKTAWRPDWKARVELSHLERRLKEDRLAVEREGRLSDKRLEAFHSRLEKSIDQVSVLAEDEHPKMDALAAELADQYSDLLDNPASTTVDLAQKEQERFKAKVDKLDDRRRQAYEKVRQKIERREADRKGKDRK